MSCSISTISHAAPLSRSLSVLNTNYTAIAMALSPHQDDDTQHWLRDEPVDSSDLPSLSSPASLALHLSKGFSNSTKELQLQARQKDVKKCSAAKIRIEETRLPNCISVTAQCVKSEHDRQFPSRCETQAVDRIGETDFSNFLPVTQCLNLERDCQLPPHFKRQMFRRIEEPDLSNRFPIRQREKEEPDCQFPSYCEKEALKRIEAKDLSNWLPVTQCPKKEHVSLVASLDLKKPKLELHALEPINHARIHDGSLTKDDDCMLAFEDLPDLGSLESHHSDQGIELSINDLIPESSNLPPPLPAVRNVTLQTNSSELRCPDSGSLSSASLVLKSSAIEAYTVGASPRFSNSLASVGNLLSTGHFTGLTPLSQERMPFSLPVPFKSDTGADGKSILPHSGCFGSHMNQSDTKTLNPLKPSLKTSIPSTSTAIAPGNISTSLTSPAIARGQRHQAMAQRRCAQDQRHSQQATRRTLSFRRKENRITSHSQDEQEKTIAHPKEQMIPSERNLRFLLQKQLRPTDVGNLGRIILPKKDAENNLPHLIAREGIVIPMTDMTSSHIWEFRFRFWPNNKSRMYLLENTGEFVKVHSLQEGDLMMLFKDDVDGTYVVRAKKCSNSNLLSITLGKRTSRHKVSHMQGRHLSSNEIHNDKASRPSEADVVNNENGFELNSNHIKCTSTCTNDIGFQACTTNMDGPFLDELVECLPDPLSFDMDSLPKLENVS